MSDYFIAPVARFDLDEIWIYYAIDLQNLTRPTAFAMNSSGGAFRKLAKTPGMGHFRGDLAAEPLRFWHVRNHLIIYRGEKRSVEIVRVLHGARDVQAILGGEGSRREAEE